MTDPSVGVPVRATGEPLALWAELPAGHRALWSGPGWRDGDVDARLAAGGLRPVVETDDGILVEPLLSWWLPPHHPSYRAPGSDATDPMYQLGVGYAAVARATELLARRAGLAAAMTALDRADRALRRVEEIVGLDRAVDIRAPRAEEPPAGPDGRALAGVLGWFGADDRRGTGTGAGWEALVPRTVRRLVRLRALVPEPADPPPESTCAVPGLADAAPELDRRAAGALATGAILAVFTPAALAAALDGAGAVLATIREAARERWPGMTLVERRLADHPLRADVDTTLRHLHTLDPAALAGRTRPGRLDEPTTTPAAWDPAHTEATLLWTDVGRRLLGTRPLPADPTMPALVVIDAIRQIVGVGLDVLDTAPVRPALGDPCDLEISES